MASSNIPGRSDRCVRQSVQVLDNISNLRHEKTTKTTTTKFGSNLTLLLRRLNGEARKRYDSYYCKYKMTSIFAALDNSMLKVKPSSIL